MKSVACIAISLLLGLSSASALVVLGFGSCPNTGTQAGFDLSRYVGVWYEYERFDNFFEVGLDCVSATYGDNGDGSISVLNAGLLQISIGPFDIVRRERSVEGRATVPDASKPAELSVSFGGVDMGSGANYFVVDTDYDNYAVVFSCANTLGFNVQFAWILTRQRGVAPSNLATIKSNLAASGVNVNKFRLIDQSDCAPPS